MANVIGEHTIKANVVNNENPIIANIMQRNVVINSNPLSYGYATTGKAGIIRIATDAEVGAGILNNVVITPYALNNVLNNAVDILNIEINKKVETIQGSALIDVTRSNKTVTIKSKTYVFEQGIASDTWVIQHNLNKRPSVIAVDTVGRTQIPDEIIYNSNNQITIQFISAFAGYAYLN